jgi:hypothetical protein
MISVTADDTMLLKDVRSYLEPVEVYDPSGKLLGLFVPANLERGKELSAQVAARVDRAEIERRMKSSEEAIPFEEVLAHLRLLEVEAERRKAAGEKQLTPEEAVAFVQALRTP